MTQPTRAQLTDIRRRMAIITEAAGPAESRSVAQALDELSSIVETYLPPQPAPLAPARNCGVFDPAVGHCPDWWLDSRVCCFCGVSTNTRCTYVPPPEQPAGVRTEEKV